MGQYHYVVNYDKRQYIHPHRFGDGLKLLEFGCSAMGTLTALSVLLAASNTPDARGGGDLHPWIKDHGGHGDDRDMKGDPKRADWLMTNVVGSWAGDRIAIIGDYCEPGDARGLVKREGSPWSREEEGGEQPDGKKKSRKNQPWEDVSALALEAMRLDYYVDKEWRETKKPVG